VKRLSLLEISLIQVAVWFTLWLLDDYIAGLLTLIVTAIVLATLLIALISEMIERSKVPRLYFSVMAVSIVAPIIAAVLYVAIFEGKFSFLP
jgi:predicted PurR-regulated permease PerM